MSWVEGPLWGIKFSQTTSDQNVPQLLANKMKMPEGESKQAVLGNGEVAEEYVKHLMSLRKNLRGFNYGVRPI